MVKEIKREFTFKVRILRVSANSRTNELRVKLDKPWDKIPGELIEDLIDAANKIYGEQLEDRLSSPWNISFYYN